MAKAQVTQVAAPQQGITLNSLSANEKRALMDQLRSELKASKGSERGEVSGIKQEGDVLWIGVKLGSAPGAVATGNNAGQPYLFQADGITFALNGANYKLGNVYAYKAKA